MGITRLVEGGIIQKSYNDYMEEEPEQDGGGEPFALTLDHLQGPFMVCIFGNVAGLVSFLVEILFRKKSTKSNEMEIFTAQDTEI